MNLNFLRQRRRLILFCIDFVIMLAATILSFFITQSLLDINLSLFRLKGSIAVLFLCCMLGLVCMNVYNNIWRYASANNYLSCIVGIGGGAFVYYAIAVVSKITHSDIITILVTLISIIGIVGCRICYNVLFRYISSRNTSLKKTRAMIVGAGDAGNRIIEEMQTSDKSPYVPVAIIDDDPEKKGRMIRGVPVSGIVKDIPHIADKLNVETIIIAIPSLNAKAKKRILGICAETVCEVKNLPYIHESMDMNNLLSQAKKINIEDLLGRDVIKLDCEISQSLINGSVCMVTGGGGSIGSELCRQVASYNPKKLIIVDIYENNAYAIQQELKRQYQDSLDLEVHIASVRDLDKMDKLYSTLKPQIVFHAAAHKHVPLMEDDPEEAVKNNVRGTYNCAMLAEKYNVDKFVLVSTDKAVNPTNVMGATKRCCEMIAQYFAQRNSDTDFVALRFGNVLGSNGSVIPLFEKQIAEGGPVTVTHPDIIRYFMTIPEAVSLILRAGAMARGGEIFVFDMGEPVKILSLAENLIRLHGKEPYVDIRIEFSGLRPGEKLFEELLMDEEGLSKTENDKIFIGKQIDIEPESFITQLNALCDAADINDSDLVVNNLRNLVPTFNHVIINTAR